MNTYDIAFEINSELFGGDEYVDEEDVIKVQKILEQRLKSGQVDALVRHSFDEFVKDVEQYIEFRKSTDENLQKAGKTLLPEKGKEYWLQIKCENPELLQAVFGSMYKNRYGSGSYVFGARLESIHFGNPKNKFIEDFLETSLNEIKKDA